LFKEKPAKQDKNTRKQRPRSAYVEDAPDVDTGNTISIVQPPPEAPPPPPAVPEQPDVNVFDFLVAEDTPKASKVPLVPGSLDGASESKRKSEYTPSIVGSEVQRKTKTKKHDPDYEERGFSYGADPIPTIKEKRQPTTEKKERPKVEYFTPAPKPKDLHMELSSMNGEYGDDEGKTTKKSTDKKRKRHQVEDLDLSTLRRPSQQADTIMSDAPAPGLHSGLTGGLGRLLSKHKFPPSPDYKNGDPEPPSPVKRSKQPQTLVVKDRGRKPPSSSTLVRVSKRRTSDESRPRKHRRSHRHHEDSQNDRERPKGKAIEYRTTLQGDDSQQLVLYKSRAELFMSFVTKGPESQSGYSMHKALKRYHREREDQGSGTGRADEEKELWKSLRLKRNERGELVVFV